MGDSVEKRLRDVEKRIQDSELKDKETQRRLGLVELQQAATAKKQTMNGEKLQALGFITDQFAQRSLRFGFVQRAITIASNNFFEILQAQAASGVSWNVLLSFVAFAALPEYMALSAVLREIVDMSDLGKADAAQYRTSVTRLGTALKSIGRTLDILRQLQASTPPGPKFTAANEVLQQAFDTTLKSITIETKVLQQVSEGIANDSLGDKPMTQVMVFWSQSKLEKLVAQDFDDLMKESDVMAEFLLYDILRQYCKQYVRMDIEDYMTDNLSKVSSSDVAIRGLNSAQLALVYKHFSTVPWKVPPAANPPVDRRPPVKDWRDLIASWGVSPTFVGPDGPD
jgi:DNA-binding transcriptional LysR family regulator